MTTIEHLSTRQGPSVPHGGRLIDRRIDADEARTLAGPAPSLILSAAELADLRAPAKGL